jgi:hypothetical protein
VRWLVTSSRSSWGRVNSEGEVMVGREAGCIEGRLVDIHLPKVMKGLGYLVWSHLVDASGG